MYVCLQSEQFIFKVEFQFLILGMRNRRKTDDTTMSITNQVLLGLMKVLFNLSKALPRGNDQQTSICNQYSGVK